MYAHMNKQINKPKKKRKKEILTDTTLWINMGDIILSDISHSYSDR
jgi:hypothetical protein